MAGHKIPVLKIHATHPTSFAQDLGPGDPAIISIYYVHVDNVGWVRQDLIEIAEEYYHKYTKRSSTL